MKKLFALLAAALLTITVGQAQTNGLTASPIQLKDAPADTWGITVGGVMGTPASDFGSKLDWGGEIGLFKIIKLNAIKTELGLRQGIGYGTVGTETVTETYPCFEGEDASVTSTKDKEGWLLRTEAVWDWNIPVYKGFSAFVGPSVSLVWGNVTAEWFVGPEAGVKLALSESAAWYVRYNYDFPISNSRDVMRVASGLQFTF